MFSKRTCSCSLTAVLSLCGFFAVAPAHANECTASGATLKLAAQQYAHQCSSPRKDCDKVNGLWYCSNETIDADRIVLSGLSQQPVTTPAPVSVVAAETSIAEQPLGTSLCVDPDNDGWGWNGTASCRVQGILTIVESTPEVVTDNQSGISNSACMDSDGDGWGWNGAASCKVASVDAGQTNAVNSFRSVVEVASVNTQNCIDQDGDGWGWNGIASCKTNPTIDAVTVINIPDNQYVPSYNQTSSRIASGAGSSVPDNCEKIDSGDYHITELVTDVFLTAGQSNATGDGTAYDPGRYEKDKLNNRVLVWTENNRWEVANPATQAWHNGLYPAGKGKVGNHPAFQIGRAIADRDECRVVAFIATAASGMPINYWLNNEDGHYSHIGNTVSRAINALPVKHQVDMIWWMQGEADNDQIVSRYFYRLSDLIGRFRSESWFPYNGYFLANETRMFPYANEAIRMLATDGSVFTDYSRGEDTPADWFPAKANEDSGAHFSAVSLRKIGDLVAEKYVEQYLSNRRQ